MPSFLTKVFGRKKDEKEHASGKRHSTSGSGTSLLEGKFEAVSPNVSPSATHFTEGIPQVKEKEKDKDTPFSLFRPKSRQPSSSSPDATRSSSPKPLLTLSLSEAQEEKNRALGVVFEADPDVRRVLPESVIGERRLNPAETLSLVKACSTAIVDRGGLETLGVMHPHWYSASSDIQRKLISLFILSLTSQGQALTLPPSSSPSSVFESELSYTRSPHDIAAVLRWALRHLQLDSNSFGANTTAPSGSEETWQWYTAYAEAERSSAFPSDAFTKSLVPQLPSSHHELLKATLDIISSLAAHAETNGSSGSKLSKFLGLWLLTAQRSQASDDWSSFYARWERAGRILEHLYLSYIRDEASHEKMPIRLLGLVKQYPYGNSATEDGLLPRPRFSTRRFNALFVRAETQLPDTRATKTKLHPVKLIGEALKAEVSSDLGEHTQLWEKVKQAAIDSENGDKPDAFSVSRVFDEDTLNLLALIPLEETSPVISISIPSPPPVIKTGRRRSASFGGAKGNGNGKATSPIAISPSSPPDWVDFSSAGFGESSLGKDFAATLMDKDVEKTSPPDISRQSSKKRRATSPTIPYPPNRRSVEKPLPSPTKPTAAAADANASKEVVEVKPKATQVKLVQLDEAFVDFWSDAFTDPIAASWPSFVVCKLKPSVDLTANAKPIKWVVIEHTYTFPPTATVEPSSPTATRRAASPKPSLMSNRKSSTFTAARKHLSLFSSKSSKNTGAAKIPGLASPTFGGRKKATMSPRIGEMGEILPEVEEGSTEPKASESTQPATATSATGLGITTEAEVPDVPPKIEAEVETKVEAELPPVPLVNAPRPVDEAVPDTTEPVNTDEDHEKPTVALATDLSPVAEEAPAAVATTEETETVEAEEKSLPPAPEPVVLGGSTPGPQVALDTSEPVALAGAVAPDVPSKDEDEEKPQPPTPVEETVTEAVEETEEPLESKEVEKEAAVPEVATTPVVPKPVEPVVESVKEEPPAPVEVANLIIPAEEPQVVPEPTEPVVQTPPPASPVAKPEELATEPTLPETVALVEETAPSEAIETQPVVEDPPAPVQEVKVEPTVVEAKVEVPEEVVPEPPAQTEVVETVPEPTHVASEPDVASVQVPEEAPVEVKTEPEAEPRPVEPAPEPTKEITEPATAEPSAPVEESAPSTAEAESSKETPSVPPTAQDDPQDPVDPVSKFIEHIDTIPQESDTDKKADHLDSVQGNGNGNGSHPEAADDVVARPSEIVASDVEQTSAKAEEPTQPHPEEKPSATDP